MINKKYRILSPDGFDIERDRTYSENELKPALDCFVARYALQGYYSTSNREKIALCDIAECCEIITI